ncbi:MAG TPA: MOSC and FAD-binding oxidoreductase domain-containing protein [Baekduia sp.]|uniref:MOSC and FAD-binding oxidoreductase domain-containing protein n=1 Tax=Baekduia sp. TaxID=2600305 RepID=UPI002CD3ECF4|nr:MOSC and FAD-binding oxidoreductase domain-containing protein [Baekduia sp.]HMJ37815.1 MOSC and FAD-binding oxidoreductase domain-containing protein [Baekduia sp.]
MNVGRPREVEWEGKTVRTAIWKEPVAGPRMVRTINIDGDDQADRRAHGGEHRAVFVYQIESYKYWERELGRHDFTHGQFGENFTVDGLADDEVCIGDRYRIGGALFEVTQPRVTCYRVGIRMELAGMPSLLVAHHRPGFYLRVLEEGEVEAGDDVVKVADGPERITVADVDALLYLPNRSRALLERALHVPALSEGWQGSFRQLLAGEDGAAADAPAWTGFRPMRVSAIERESDTITSFRLVPTEGAATPVGRAGQYLTVRVRPDADGPALVRSYSLSSLPGDDGFRISVKREGAVSRFLHDRAAIGAVLDVAAPRGSFILRRGEGPIVLLSAGVGATPVLAMLHELVRERSLRPVWWIHAARNAREHAFAREAQELLGRLPETHRLVAYSRATGVADQGMAYDIAGRIDPAAVDRADVPKDADYYLCGPEGFMHALSAALTARGVAPERVATEAFGSVAVTRSGIVEADTRAPHPPGGRAGDGPAVTFGRSGLSVAWDDRFPSLLDLAEACSVPVGFGCRTGVCHNCESGLVAGAVEYTTQPLEHPPRGRVLVCCSRPAEDVTLDL